MRMRHVNPRVAALLAALAVAAVLAALAGCENTPTATFDNPFDPDGPTGGDGLQVTAVAADTVIFVFWNQPQTMGITRYIVSHTNDLASEWVALDTLAATTKLTGQYSYTYPEPAVLHYFRVQAFTATQYNLLGYSHAAVALGLPQILPTTGGRARPSRYLDLEVVAGVGDTLELAADDTFTDPQFVPVVDPTQPQIVPWDLGESRPGAAHQVNLRVHGPGTLVSGTVKLDFTASFAPQLKTLSGATSMASRRVDLVVPTAGVTGMRLSLSADSLALKPWLAPNDTIRGFLLAETAAAQKVWGQFRGDFGYDTTSSVTLTPNNLSTATFLLDVPASRVITGPAVTCRSAAVATEMRIGENSAFIGVPWQPYAASTSVTLSPGTGRKVLYAQYRNDWFDSDVFSAYVDVAGQDLAVAILAPGDGDEVIGGTPLQVQGTSLAGSASSKVDSLKVDLGDGLGFRRPTGTTSWSLMWDVPAVTEDTPVTLRARAWAVDTADTTIHYVATTSATVTVKAPAAP